MDFEQLLGRIYQQYPRLKGRGFQAGIEPSLADSPGDIEFFHPRESRSPRPGVPYIGLREGSPLLQDEDLLQRAIMGDMLHYMPDVDPAFGQMREDYRRSITPEQALIDQRAYRYGQHPQMAGQETRSFDRWMDMSRLDAHLRGYLAPDARNEWAGSYTPEQAVLLQRMKQYLMGQ